MSRCWKSVNGTLRALKALNVPFTVNGRAPTEIYVIAVSLAEFLLPKKAESRRTLAR